MLQATRLHWFLRQAVGGPLAGELPREHDALRGVTTSLKTAGEEDRGGTYKKPSGTEGFLWSVKKDRFLGPLLKVRATGPYVSMTQVTSGVRHEPHSGTGLT